MPPTINIRQLLFSSFLSTFQPLYLVIALIGSFSIWLSMFIPKSIYSDILFFVFALFVCKHQLMQKQNTEKIAYAKLFYELGSKIKIFIYYGFIKLGSYLLVLLLIGFSKYLLGKDKALSIAMAVSLFTYFFFYILYTGLAYPILINENGSVTDALRKSLKLLRPIQTPIVLLTFVMLVIEILKTLLKVSLFNYFFLFSTPIRYLIGTQSFFAIEIFWKIFVSVFQVNLYLQLTKEQNSDT